MRTIVVIPVYNDAQFLQSCLEYITKQTLAPDKIIIVDNNCTDNSASIATRHESVVVITEPTQGICVATKTGLNKALDMGADIILRCDADSMPPQEWIEKSVNNLRQDQVVATTGPGIFYDIPSVLRPLASILYMKAYFWSVGLALGQKPLFGSNFAIKSSAWREIKNSNHLNLQDVHDDIDISYHLSTIGTIKYDEMLIMPISGRPFKSLTGMLKRYKIGLKSIIIHWPEQSPWRRFMQNRLK